MTDPIRDIVTGWLKGDEDAPCKQRHTAERVYQRLAADYHFSGGKSTIRKLVKELKAENAKDFVPLNFDPGEAAQVDWGEATNGFLLAHFYFHLPIISDLRRDEIFLTSYTITLSQTNNNGSALY